MPSIKNRSGFFATTFIVVCAVVLSSCESNRWFQSEDSLNAKIQNTWKKIKINPSSASEVWTFSEGKVFRLKTTATDTAQDVGNYSISTSLSKAYVNITDFTLVMDELNAKWEILELDGGVLFIATDHDGTTGVKQLEFEEQ